MGSEVERAAAPALLNDLLASQASADALQKSLAMEDTGSQTQTQVCYKTLACTWLLPHPVALVRLGRSLPCRAVRGWHLLSSVSAKASSTQLAATISACWYQANGSTQSSPPQSRCLSNVPFWLAAGQWGGCPRRRRQRRCCARQLGPAARLAGAHGAARRPAAAAHAGAGTCCVAGCTVNSVRLHAYRGPRMCSLLLG